MLEYSIGIDLGGTKVLTALVNTKNGDVVSYIKKKTKKDKGPEKIVQKIINSIRDLVEENKLKIENIKDIGIGVR